MLGYVTLAVKKSHRVEQGNNCFENFLVLLTLYESATVPSIGAVINLV